MIGGGEGNCFLRLERFSWGLMIVYILGQEGVRFAGAEPVRGELESIEHVLLVCRLDE